MSCYATLFSSWILADNGHFEKLLQENLRPEIGLEYGGTALSIPRHREVARIIHEHGLSCAVHLPFINISLGAQDRQTREASRSLLLKSLEVANIYEPDHLIAHPQFTPPTKWRHHPGDWPLEAPENKPDEDWLEHSVQGWSEVLDLCPGRLFLENTADQSPVALMTLLNLLPKRAAMCLDVGHWHYAGHGHRLFNFTSWLDIVEKRLGHLHLHDNNGHSDQHLGLGRSGINFQLVMEQINQRGLTPSATLEAHNKVELDYSLAWLHHFGWQF